MLEDLLDLLLVFRIVFDDRRFIATNVAGYIELFVVSREE